MSGLHLSCFVHLEVAVVHEEAIANADSNTYATFARVNAAGKTVKEMGFYTKELCGGIIDCQLETPHLKSMGARYISYEDYLASTLSPDGILWP